MLVDRLRPLYADVGPYASAYLEVSRDQEDGNHVVDLAVRAVCDDLTARGAPGGVVEEMATALARSTGEPAPISRCVVASERGVLLDELVRAGRTHPVASWGPLPELAEWITDASRSVEFVLALVDHEGADVTTYAANGVNVQQDETVGESAGWEHKVRGGGWSHLNWQRSAETVWSKNADEAATEVERQLSAGAATLVVVAGDERSRSMVADALPTSEVEVVVLDRAGRAVDGGDDALAADVEDAVRGHVLGRHLNLLHELRERVGRDDAVAVGIADVADAFVRGQVGHLLLDADAAQQQTLRIADHPGLTVGAGEPDGELFADQALIAASVLSDAEVDVVGPAALPDAPVAALLRWDQTPE